jgi:hypothetical protein
MPKRKLSTVEEAERARRILDEHRDEVDGVRDGAEPGRPGIRGKADRPGQAGNDKGGD